MAGEDSSGYIMMNDSDNITCWNTTCYSNYSTIQDQSQSNSTALPPSLGFDDNAMKDIIVYCVLFVIAAVGNLTVFITLFRNRHWKSRVSLMIMHLAAADLMVTFIMIPLEVGWRITTQWVAGNPACKIFQFLRAFGLYLSSMVLICISLDRYFAILHPLKVNDAQRRSKLMLAFAWVTAAVCSVPQSVIFHVDTHPDYPSFHQCVTFGFFSTQIEEMAYNLFCLTVMYFLPLVFITVVYARILWEISQKSKDSKEDLTRNRDSNGAAGPRYRLRLRRSDMSNIERARARTLKMTLIIVVAFIWCWTPYVVMVMWYMFDRESAEKVDRRLQDALFIMAVSNSCVNPLVYGSYTINLRNELSRCFGRKEKSRTLVRRPTASSVYRTANTVLASSCSTRLQVQNKAMERSLVIRHVRSDATDKTELFGKQKKHFLGKKYLLQMVKKSGHKSSLSPHTSCPNVQTADQSLTLICRSNPNQSVTQFAPNMETEFNGDSKRSTITLTSSIDATASNPDKFALDF